MSACVLIPARYKSTRFEGKPLALINGEPMIIHTARQCVKAVGVENVYVVTDDERVENVVIKHGYRCLIVDKHCETGTDRIAEAAKILDYDVFVNVQGDEPLVNPKTIQNTIQMKRMYSSDIINCYSNQYDDNEKTINMVFKTVGRQKELIYASRSSIPSLASLRFKQVCVYAFYKYQLIHLFGAGEKKSHNETLEDIEILRFVDNSVPVKMVKSNFKTHSVDYPEDIKIVEDILCQNNG